MNWVDFALIGAAAAFAWAGWRSGLAASLVRLAGVVLAVAVAGAWHDRVLVDLALVSEAPTGWARAATFAVLMAAVIAAGWFAGQVARGMAKALMLGWADAGGGAVLGLLFAVLATQALIAIVVIAPISELRDAVAGSAIGSAMMETAPLVEALLPAEFDAAIVEFVEEARARASAAG